MAKLFNFSFGKKKVETRSASYSVPDKIYIEKASAIDSEYSLQPPGLLDRFHDLLNGYYSNANFIELFHCLPELFAPIHEIASRVSDAVWQLKKERNDEIDWEDKHFNKLFSQPNPLQNIKQLIYNAVCYEILTGKQLWYFNKPETLPGWSYKDVMGWHNLPAQDVYIDTKKTDPYSATTIDDLISEYRLPLYDSVRKFRVENVLPILHLSLKDAHDLNKTMPLVMGAEKAIKNLIPVYEARGTVYIKRGVMGFIVSRKQDESGALALTKKERQELDKDFSNSYGVTGGRETIAMTGMPVDFVKTAMSIQEMEPFAETLADAAAIYAVLRVPPHLIPSKDKSTFNNASTDMKSFYEDVIIPWAKRYAEMFTTALRLTEVRRYICVSFEHLGKLQDDKKAASEADKNMGIVWQQRFNSGVCSLNDWIVATGAEKGIGPIFEKRLPEMTPEELEQVKAFLNLKAIAKDEKTSNAPETTGSETESTTD